MSLSFNRSSTLAWDADAWVSLLQSIPGMLSVQLDPEFTKKYSHRLLWGQARSHGVYQSAQEQIASVERIELWFQHELATPHFRIQNPFYLSMEENSDLPWIKVEAMPGMNWAFSLCKRITPFRFFLMTNDFQGGLAFWEEEHLYRSVYVFPKRILKLGEWANEISGK